MRRAGVVESMDLATVSLQRIPKFRRRRLIVLEHVTRLALIGALRNRLLRGVPAVRGFHRPATHASETTTHRLRNTNQLVLCRVELRLVLQSERDRVTEPRL